MFIRLSEELNRETRYSVEANAKFFDRTSVLFMFNCPIIIQRAINVIEKIGVRCD